MGISNDHEVTFRAADWGEIDAIARFLRETNPHNPKADPEILRWQYQSARFGPTVTMLAEHKGRIVGHYTLFGMPAILQGSPVEAAHGADLVIHPDYRGRGLAPRLLEATYEMGRRAGYEIVVSNPNHTSLPAFRRAGLRSLPAPAAYFLTLHPQVLAKRLPAQIPKRLLAATQPVANVALKVAHFRGSRPGRVENTIVVSARLPHDAGTLLSTQADDTYTGVVLNNEDWWRWRYEAHPRQPYRFVQIRNPADILVGLAVIGPHPDGSQNAWLFSQYVAVNQQIFGALVRGAAQDAQARGAHVLLTATSSSKAHSQAREQLRKVGFLPLPHRLSGRALHLGVTDLSGKLLDIKARDWAFNFGDQDHL